MATVKVKFRPSTVKDRPGTIVYLVTHHRVARQITTEYKIYPHEWDERKSTVVATVENRLHIITQRICWDKERLNEIVGKFEKKVAKGIPPMMWFRSSGEPVTTIVFSVSWKMS